MALAGLIQIVADARRESHEAPAFEKAPRDARTTPLVVCAPAPDAIGSASAGRMLEAPAVTGMAVTAFRRSTHPSLSRTKWSPHAGPRPSAELGKDHSPVCTCRDAMLVNRIVAAAGSSAL